MTSLCLGIRGATVYMNPSPPLWSGLKKLLLSYRSTTVNMKIWLTRYFHLDSDIIEPMLDCIWVDPDVVPHGVPAAHWVDAESTVAHPRVSHNLCPSLVLRKDAGWAFAIVDFWVSVPLVLVPNHMEFACGGTTGTRIGERAWDDYAGSFQGPDWARQFGTPGCRDRTVKQNRGKDWEWREGKKRMKLERKCYWYMNRMARLKSFEKIYILHL